MTQHDIISVGDKFKTVIAGTRKVVIIVEEIMIPVNTKIGFKKKYRVCQLTSEKPLPKLRSAASLHKLD